MATELPKSAALSVAKNDILFQMWDYILDYYEGKIECDDYYDVRKCHEDPEETNYRIWCRNNQTRRAIHVGELSFMGLQGETYDALIPDIMQSKREEIGGLLNDYPVGSKKKP